MPEVVETTHLRLVSELGCKPSFESSQANLKVLKREKVLPQCDSLHPLTEKGFKLYSFQLQDPKEPCISIYCHYLPVSGLGNLRACCLPWMW